MKIEFFHDTICSFCYPMSYQMRKFAAKRPDIEIIHRSFALVKEPASFDAQFGSRPQAKEEVLHHWARANQFDEESRFNIEGMRQADFPFPSSMPALRASKAAYKLAGDNLYWDVFDRLQKGLFSEAQNIEDEAKIKELVAEVLEDDNQLEQWETLFHSEEVLEEVENDLRLVARYGIDSVPSIVIDEKYLLPGVRKAEDLLKILEKLPQRN